eukprot:4299653-Alexandrium_andersonii.AAC.1
MYRAKLVPLHFGSSLREEEKEEARVRSLHARAIVPCALASPLAACTSSTVERIWSIGSRVRPLSYHR